MLVNGKIKHVLDKENVIIMMEDIMKVIGNSIHHVVKEEKLKLMALFMRVLFSKDYLTDNAQCKDLMADLIKAIG